MTEGPLLFQPLKLRDVTLPNRVVVSPMCMYSAQGGLANDFHLVHLGQYALAGTGLIIAEATAVSPEGRISPEDLGLWEDRQIIPLGRVTDFVHAQGGLIGVQLAHAGRKASTYAPWRGRGAVPPERGGWDVIGPDASAYNESFPQPHAMTPEDIAGIVGAFRQAARRAEIAGFDVVEIHAAHGYLLHQFLSPLANSRNDEYGGSFENRTRLVLEVTRAVREVWPHHKPLFVRLSATDWAPGGWDESQTVVLAGLLAREGVDVLDLSSGGLTPEQQITPAPGYQTPFAAQVKAAVPDLTVMTVGMIDTPERAEAILRNGDADLIALARPVLGDPHWVQAAARNLGAEHTLPAPYARGTRTT
ncbi:NADH:flavin oxidoreductase/NADH oxidase [Deinococcus soli (ex Cha et al. 2016)]|uniref:2,4-dienoyl-CoA reductase-like NADH-dependent reductase (Old Yellow Enzyme family) n=2 Tax=Deinococcus soli (ex Cha et al. 2016) TaxID=1309411 RepID=A0AAE3X9N2_9DEIO|nr:NADH:flavin oxidoreductase/NADH oxidase [Deinococcus soli (ex Cha et al. 2016)]MDR6217181.1 2,4-dienoyl-CoA reductase-like NADH-dependent reductase (Old Yellow Enzyme family) [Deinococcus soli (ex Cha et al. 2016)]MDR6326490.1 2,4-dienoyl-CoA reductase-like NADH-dependent reductase (Old Yellow Enzyme family) [Deinococcus soli (ex Cha et al. 2016)]MDR6750783.1 2,4-dienoyl-CoA reductase-like NADH-dependent reductase (Old Yellow Enzyme family) [Deinococcus soli (ex Cha et al. 2016)]GGB72408.1 o